MQADADTELPDQGDKIIRTRDLDLIPNPDGLGCELYQNMKKFSIEIAQMDTETEEQELYESLLKRCVRTAIYLKKQGVTQEDVVALCTDIHMDTTVAYVAPLFVGCKVACIDPYTASDDIKAEMELLQPKLMFVIKGAEDMIDKYKEELKLNVEIVVFGETSKNTPFKNLVKSISIEEEENFEPTKAKDLFDTTLIAFSSGSSGTPKGICLNHNAIICQTQRFKGINTKTKGLAYSSPAWVSAQLNIISKIFFGMVNLISWPFEPSKVWKYLVKYDINSLMLAPRQFVEFLNYGNPDELETPKLQLVYIGGGKISTQNMDSLKKLFKSPIITLNLYGQSEVFGPLLIPGKIEKQMRRPASAGVPIRGFWYKVVDLDTGKILGPNQQGELCIKSKFIMNGYYQKDSSDCFDSDGFLKTGDVVYYDDEHFFYIIERCREAMKYKSHWFAPTYLESILSQHPGVKLTCVMGLPSEEGDLATAVVVKSDSGKDVTEEELLKFVNDQVDDIKRIRGGVIFVEEDFIPFTPSDKIRRYTLRNKIKELRNIE